MTLPKTRPVFVILAIPQLSPKAFIPLLKLSISLLFLENVIILKGNATTSYRHFFFNGITIHHICRRLILRPPPSTFPCSIKVVGMDSRPRSSVGFCEKVTVWSTKWLSPCHSQSHSASSYVSRVHFNVIQSWLLSWFMVANQMVASWHNRTLCSLYMHSADSKLVHLKWSRRQ